MSRVRVSFPAPFLHNWRHRQVVRQRSAKSLSPVRIRVSPPRSRRSGGIGRHKGLKIPRALSLCRFKSGLWYHIEARLLPGFFLYFKYTSKICFTCFIKGYSCCNNKIITLRCYRYLLDLIPGFNNYFCNTIYFLCHNRINSPA